MRSSDQRSNVLSFFFFSLLLAFQRSFVFSGLHTAFTFIPSLFKRLFKDAFTPISLFAEINIDACGLLVLSAHN